MKEVSSAGRLPIPMTKSTFFVVKGVLSVVVSGPIVVGPDEFLVFRRRSNLRVSSKLCFPLPGQSGSLQSSVPWNRIGPCHELSIHLSYFC